MLKTRIAIIVTLVVGFVAFHLVEQAWHGGRAPSFPEELLFIGGLVFGVSLLVAGILRLRLIQRVNQVSARARRDPARGQLDGAARQRAAPASDLAELSDAVNGLLEVADASQRELRESERRLAAQSQALTELTSRQTGASVTVGDRLRLILETCARTLEVARVSTWRFEENGAALRCDDLFQSRHRPALVWRAAVRARRPCLLQRHRPRPCRRGDRCPRRPADARVQRVLPDTARHRRHARRAAPPGGSAARRDVHRARRRAAGVEVRRAELCAVARQPRRRRPGRRRSAAGGAESGRERGAGAAGARFRARRVHRHGLRRPDRPLERAGGGDVRLDARRSHRSAAVGHDHSRPASARRTSKACATSTRRARRRSSTGGSSCAASIATGTSFRSRLR